MTVTSQGLEKSTTRNWWPSGDQRGRPYPPSCRRPVPSAFMSQTPDSAPGTAPGLSRKITRSPDGERPGQLPGPRSLTERWPSSSSRDLIRDRLKSAIPGVASKRIRLPSCDQAGEPHWLSQGSGSLAMSVASPPSASIRKSPTRPAAVEGSAGCFRSCSTRAATVWPPSPTSRLMLGSGPGRSASWAPIVPQVVSGIDNPSGPVEHALKSHDRSSDS